MENQYSKDVKNQLQSCHQKRKENIVFSDSLKEDVIVKKKVLAVLLTAVMALGALAACGGSGNTGNGSAAANNSAAPAETNNKTSETQTATGDIPKIVMETLYFDAVPRDLAAVEAAMNEISIPEIGVQVELYPLGFSEASQQVGLMISSGQQLDLVVCAGRSDFLSLVNKNMVLDLDELIATVGQPVAEAAAKAIPGGYVGGKLYGIPSIEKYGSINGLCIDKSIVDAVGWTKFDLTMEELGDFLAQAKAVTDKHLIHLSGGGNAVANFEMMNTVDYLGADIACGGILGVGSAEGDKVVNIFATEEYRNYCKLMHEWYEAGYFNLDAATNNDSGQAAVTAGTGAGYFIKTELDMVDQQAAANGIEMVGLNTRPHIVVTGDIAQQTWSIPYTCADPEAAMKVMNLMWTNEDFINLMYYGIEDLDYRTLEDGRIGFLEGEAPQTVGFHQWFGLYGNVALKKVWEASPADYKEQLEAFNNDVTAENSSKFYGYAFNPDIVKTEYAAVNDVISTYRTSLECGVVDDVDGVVDQFVKDLEAAGINTIIEANQKALDEWKAQQ